MKTAKCRSCGATVIWTVTKNGRKMPVDAEPSEAGTFRLDPPPPGPDDTPAAVWLAKGSAPGQQRTSHFDTCPSAGQWRKS